MRVSLCYSFTKIYVQKTGVIDMKWLRSKKVINTKFVNFVDKLLPAMIAGLTGFSFVAIVLLLLSQFHTVLIWTLGPIVAIVCAWIVFKFGSVERPGTTKVRLICDLIVIVGVLVWGGYNIFYTSQHILTNRDPGVYANAASWLAERTNLQIEVPDTLNGVSGVSIDSQGFEVARGKQDKMYTQGQHILPALLGSIGKFIGPKHLLHFNILFGMMALFAIYCFARLFMKPYWAIIGCAVMAVSLPMLYFSRDTYTEPLALAFTFGGLALIWIAQQNKRLLLWALAGLTIGASVLTRIDGWLGLIGVAAFLVVYAIFVKKEDRRQRFLHVLSFTIPASAMCLLAWLDLKLFSANYYTDHAPAISLEITMLIGIVLVGIVGSVIVIKYPNILKWMNAKTIKWRALACALLVLLIGLFFVSRPIWMEGVTAKQNLYVAGLQQFEHSIVEPRSYSEITTNWVSWYIGPVLVCLGLIGLAYATYKSMRDKDMVYLCGLFVIVGTSIVYFIKPSIIPDQIWASRRMLPVIMPGVAIFGVYMLSIVADKIKFHSKIFKNSVIVVVGLGLLIAPLTVSSPFIGNRDTAQYALIPDLCENLPSNASVIWVGAGRLTMVQPTRTYCHVESYGYGLNNTDKPTTKKLAEIAVNARSHGKIPIVASSNARVLGLLGDVGLVDGTEQDELTQISSAIYLELVPLLTAPPKNIRKLRIGISLSIIENDGGLKPITK